MNKPITFRDTVYPSFKALYRARASAGLTYACVYSRWKSGIELEVALTTPNAKYQSRKYTVDGTTYDSLRHLSEAAGISYVAAVKRAHRGFSDHEIFYGKRKSHFRQKNRKSNERGEKVKVAGIEYRNIRAAFDSIKPSVSINTVRGRLRYGWSLAEALDVELRPDGRTNNSQVVLMELNGTEINASTAAKMYDVSYSTLLDRIKRGASPEQAVGIKPIFPGDLIPQAEAYSNRKRAQRKSYFVKGKHYCSVRELAEAFELCPKLVYNRIKKNGWSPEKAVTEGIYKEVTVEGLTFKSALDAWEQIGETSFSTFQGRQTLGHELAVCLGLQKMPKEDQYSVNGEFYSSIGQIADAYDLTETQLRARLKTRSIEEALTYTPSNGRYTDAFFEKYPEIANEIGYLYFVSVVTTDGILHKVGITRRQLSARFSNAQFEAIRVYVGKLLSAYKFEKYLLGELSHFLFRADDSFDGKTETFLLMDLEINQVVSLLDKNYGKYELRLQAL